MAGILLIAVSMLLLDGFFPLPLPDDQAGFSRVLLARDGTPLRAFADDQGVWRYGIQLEDVSPRYLQALIAYEDRYYWSHPGVNPVALWRAAWQWWQEGKIISGGSTLTMQVARLLAPHDRSVMGKLQQMLRAVQLEWHLSKQQILTLYLNYAPFGGPIEGVQAASYAYLGKSVAELSHAEAALLAVLPQAPTRLRPDRHPDRAANARNKVLDRLVKQGVWSASQVAEAKQENIQALFNPKPLLAPLFARRVLNQLGSAAHRRTTIDSELQQVLEGRLAEFAWQLPNRSSVAILVVENETLAVRAYVGSVDFADPNRFGYLDMVPAIRSPGSTLKPFLYGFAIEDGLIHSHSLLSDAPINFSGYQPSNFTGGFRGPVSVSEALQRSLNIPAVQVLNHLGSAVFASRLQQGGIDLVFPKQATPNLAMILGGVGVSLEDLVAGYSALARDGLAGDLRFFEDQPITDRYLMSQGAAWVVRDILQNQSRPGIQANFIAKPKHRHIAWKTGTSYGYRDAWAIGVNAKHTVGIWVGRPDGTPLPGHYGAITAAPMMFTIFDALLGHSNWPLANAAPHSVEPQEICWPLGTVAASSPSNLCHQRHQAWIVGGQVPPTLADRHGQSWRALAQKIWLGENEKYRVTADCQLSQRTAMDIARWPQAVEPWLTAEQRQRSAIPPLDPRCKNTTVAEGQVLQIKGVNADAILRPAGGSQIKPHVSLSVIGANDPVYWMINEVVHQYSAPRLPFSHRFEKAGRYKITVLEESGNYDSLWVKVIDS